MKREIADLERRGQAAEARHEDLAGALPEATRPLLRQIAALQVGLRFGPRLTLLFSDLTVALDSLAASDVVLCLCVRDNWLRRCRRRPPHGRRVGLCTGLAVHSCSVIDQRIC